MDRFLAMQAGLHLPNHVQPVKAEDYSSMIHVIGAMALAAEKAIEVSRPVFLPVSKTEPRSD